MEGRFIMKANYKTMAYSAGQEYEEEGIGRACRVAHTQSTSSIK